MQDLVLWLCIVLLNVYNEAFMDPCTSEMNGIDVAVFFSIYFSVLLSDVRQFMVMCEFIFNLQLLCLTLL